MEGLAAFPEYLNGLNQCCVNKTCYAGFQSLPYTLSDFTNTKAFPNPLLCSKSRFCSECGLPSREGITNDELDDAEEEHANIAMDNGFTCFSPYNTARCCIFYKVSNRMYRRISGTACRRNVLNIIVYLPYINSFVAYHMTWRYAPQIIGLEPLLRRILREAMGLFEDQLEDSSYPEFFCNCEGIIFP